MGGMGSVRGGGDIYLVITNSCCGVAEDITNIVKQSSSNLKKRKSLKEGKFAIVPNGWTGRALAA